MMPRPTNWKSESAEIAALREHNSELHVDETDLTRLEDILRPASNIEDRLGATSNREDGHK